MKYSPVIITGMWHAGTRMLVNILEYAGIDFAADKGATGIKNRDFADRRFNYLCQRIIVNNEQEITYKYEKELNNILAQYFDFNKAWGFKMPVISYMIPFFLKLYPDCKVIGIVRDGRDVALSPIGVGLPTSMPVPADFENIFAFIKYYIFNYFDWNFFNKLKKKVFFDDLTVEEFKGIKFKDIRSIDAKKHDLQYLFAAQLWNISTSKMISNRGHKNYYEISYEKLCLEPEIVITDLLDYLSIKKEKKEFDNMVRIPSPDRIGKWKKADSKKVADIVEIERELLLKLNYMEE